MISDPVQKFMQRLPARLNEVLIKAFHHSFHYKLFWQWLKPREKKKLSECNMAWKTR
jgi:hypothetical protein